MLTIYSFLMSIIFSSLFVLAVHLLRKKKSFIMSFGVTTVVAAYAVCILRMLLPLEFGAKKLIILPSLYKGFIETIYNNTADIGGAEFSLFTAFLLLWAMGAVALLIRLALKYVADRRRLLVSSEYDKELNTVLDKISDKKGIYTELQVLKSTLVTVPMGMGIDEKIIAMPNREYSEVEQELILSHELTHFIHHDFVVKLLTRVFRCIFWWNPLVYMLENDIDQMLEIKCDIAVTRGLGNEGKINYLRVIVDSLQNPSTAKSCIPVLSTQLYRRKKQSTLERFEFIRDYGKPPKLMYQAATIALMLLIFFASYLFVFQPEYIPPMDDIATAVSEISKIPERKYLLHGVDGTDHTISMNPENSYVLYGRDGEYYAVRNGLVIYFPITEESAEMLISKGFELLRNTPQD